MNASSSVPPLAQLGDRQLPKSIDALLGEIDFVAEPNKVLRVRIRALQSGFAPNVLEQQGVSIDLYLKCGKETRVLEGTLRQFPSVAPRGLWFEYELVTRQLDKLDLVVFKGLNNRSNILRTELHVPGKTLSFPNPFQIED